MTEKLPTRGQLERELSQKIQALYRQNLGHQPSKVTCKLFDDKLAIILDDSITSAEQILVEGGKEELAEKVRVNIDDAIQPELKQLIANILAVEILDILSDATLDTGRTGMIAVLGATPKIRNSDNFTETKTNK
ncbi:MAG: DUF2294 domain-containing protein [Pleurocapsa sp.]